MIQLLSDALWPEIKLLAAKSRTKWAVVAYVTDDTAVVFGKGDLLITDASDHAIASGHTSALVLKRALERGAQLYCCPNLHAKVFLFDGVAVTSSSNLSQSSQNTLVEAGVVTDQPSVVSMVHRLIDQLKSQSQRIDEEFIRRIGAIPVARSGWKPKSKATVTLGTHRTWLVAVTDMDTSCYEEEFAEIEHGKQKAEQLISEKNRQIESIRFPNKSPYLFIKEAKPGDTIIQIWTRQGRKRPLVLAPVPILNKEQGLKATHVFVAQPSDAVSQAMTWSQFQTLAKQTGLPSKISVRSVRAIPERYVEALTSLWKS